MASTAFDSPDADAAARPPLSTHPAFPAVVALWFAALLGLGSLVLPAALFDSLFASVGLDALVPLGFATRVGLAVFAALAGAAAGVAIARRVAARHAGDEESGAAPARETHRRPLNVREDLAEVEDAPVTRRRARSLLAADPVPDAFDAPVAADEAAVEPVAEDPGIPAEEILFERQEDISLSAETDNAPAAEAEPLLAPPPPAAIEAPMPPAPMEPAAPRPFRSDWTSVAPEQLGLVQLVERLGTSLERRREWLAEAPVAVDPPEAMLPEPFDAARADEAVQAMADYFARPLASPAAFDGPVEAPREEPREEPADDLAEALSTPLPPVALEPFVPEDAGLDDEFDDDGSFGSLLAMRGPFAAKAPDPAYDDEGEDGDWDGDGRLAGDSAEAAPPVEPAGPRPFDPPAAAEPEPRIVDTDAQLREALAALQRVRGAA